MQMLLKKILSALLHYENTPLTKRAGHELSNVLYSFDR